jgi:hypothetical protein
LPIDVYSAPERKKRIRIWIFVLSFSERKKERVVIVESDSVNLRRSCVGGRL